MKVMTLLGTRPEIIRLARVMALLETTVEHRIVHTGQNHDYALNEVFFKELGIRDPDYFLEVDTSSLGALLGEILIRFEPVLLDERPEAVLVLGDTNSSIGAILAKRHRIPTYHMEAGNRCFDANVPEEVNRRIIDHVADFNLAYTEHARRNLLAEGLHPSRTYVTGSPLAEVIEYYRESIVASDVVHRLGLTPGEYFLVSMHREENVDFPASLRSLLDAFRMLVDEYGFPVVVSTHPRTRKRLKEHGLEGVKGLSFAEPFGYFDYNRLQLDAACVLSDSGTVSEESALLEFPAVTIRTSIERPEALDTGSIVLSGLHAEGVVECVRLVRQQFALGMRPEVPADYQVRNCAQRVVNLIVGTAKVHADWANLKRRDR